MPNEDKLTHEERLRLEALNQAIQCSPFMKPVNRPEDVIERANKFANWILSGVVTGNEEINDNKH